MKGLKKAYREYRIERKSELSVIKYNIIAKISSLYREYREYYGNEGFFYFNSIISKGDKDSISIDRIKGGFLYECEVITPKNWSDIDGKTLFKVLNRMNMKDFYFYKNIDGKLLKMKPKK